jgi:hypothetical protein
MVESEIAEQLRILTLSCSLTGLGTARLTELLGRRDPSLSRIRAIRTGMSLRETGIDHCHDRE